MTNDKDSPVSEILCLTYEVIFDYIKKHGFSPTLNEVSKLLGITRQGAHYNIKRLGEMGCLKNSRTSNRNIVLIKHP